MVHDSGLVRFEVWVSRDFSAVEMFTKLLMKTSTVLRQSADIPHNKPLTLEGDDFARWIHDGRVS